MIPRTYMGVCVDYLVHILSVSQLNVLTIQFPNVDFLRLLSQLRQPLFKIGRPNSTLVPGF